MLKIKVHILIVVIGIVYHAQTSRHGHPSDIYVFMTKLYTQALKYGGNSGTFSLVLMMMLCVQLQDMQAIQVNPFSFKQFYLLNFQVFLWRN